jgi:tetratricopeptide (TPR) repeat protein
MSNQADGELLPAEGVSQPSLSAIEHEPTSTRLLKSIRRRIRNGEFEDELLADAKRLERELRELESEDLLYFRAVNSVAEVYDYFGLYRDGRLLLAKYGALAVAGSDEWRREEFPDRQAVLKERVILLMNVGLSHYRDNQPKSARVLFDKSRKLLKESIENDEDPCHSSWSVLEYFSGQLHRQNLDFREAAVAFSASIEQAHKRVRWCIEHPRSDHQERIAQEENRARRRTALALALGLGWMAARQGALQQALPLFLTARALLSATGDWVGKEYVELLYGTVRRCMAGVDSSQLRDTIEILKVPYRRFSPSNVEGESSGHLPYKAHAAYQLALACLYANEYSKCSEYLHEVRRFAKAANNERWECTSIIIESRLLRYKGEIEQAFELANQALAFARKIDDRPSEIESLIVLGEAKMNLKHLIVSSVDDFRMALGKVLHNVQTEAVCHLHLASAHLQSNNVTKAKEHMDAWKRIEGRNENQVVLGLARRVQEELDRALSDFVVRRKEENLSYEFHLARLWNFLDELAMSRSKNNTRDAAELLNVSIPTVYRNRARAKDIKLAETKKKAAAT